MRDLDPTISVATKTMSKGVEAQLNAQSQFIRSQTVAAIAADNRVRKVIRDCDFLKARRGGAFLTLDDFEFEIGINAKLPMKHAGGKEKRGQKQERERERAKETRKRPLEDSVAKLREKFGK